MWVLWLSKSVSVKYSIEVAIKSPGNGGPAESLPSSSFIFAYRHTCFVRSHPISNDGVVNKICLKNWGKFGDELRMIVH